MEHSLNHFEIEYSFHFHFSSNVRIGYPNCDNALLHGTAPVHGAPITPAWAAYQTNHGAHSYAYQSAPAYNHYDDGQYHPEYNGAYHDYSTNDIHGQGGDKYD